MDMKVYWKIEAAGKLKTDKACALPADAERVKAQLEKDGWTVTEITKTAYDKIVIGGRK
jgi:hypothetical protein